MKKMLILFGLSLVVGLAVSCHTELVEYGNKDLKVYVEKGANWLHDFPLFLGINKKNPPQIAIWLEDIEGNYLSTLYVSRKIATQSWQVAGGNRRKEALPVWCHVRGVQYADGLYLPTAKDPFTDGLTGATPRGSFDVRLTPGKTLNRFVVKIEINHSTDFNEAYPETARQGDANYSGGEKGSGQPAVVYSAVVDLDSDAKVFPASWVGHSSPDGSGGSIYPGTDGLTSALHLVKQIIVSRP